MPYCQNFGSKPLIQKQEKGPQEPQGPDFDSFPNLSKRQFLRECSILLLPFAIGGLLLRMSNSRPQEQITEKPKVPIHFSDNKDEWEAVNPHFPDQPEGVETKDLVAIGIHPGTEPRIEGSECSALYEVTYQTDQGPRTFTSYSILTIKPKENLERIANAE